MQFFLYKAVTETNAGHEAVSICHIKDYAIFSSQSHVKVNSLWYGNGTC